LADRTNVEGLDLPGRLQKLVEVFGVDFLEGNASAHKLAVVHHLIIVFVGLKKRFADGFVQFDVVGFVKVVSDSVEQLLELVLGQRLGGVVRVQGSEKIVDLRPLAVRQRNAVRFSGVNVGASVPGCVFGATARLALFTGIPSAFVCVASFVGFFVEIFVHSEEGDVIQFSMAQQTGLGVVGELAQLSFRGCGFQLGESSVRTTKIDSSAFVRIRLLIAHLSGVVVQMSGKALSGIRNSHGAVWVAEVDNEASLSGGTFLDMSSSR